MVFSAQKMALSASMAFEVYIGISLRPAATAKDHENRGWFNKTIYTVVNAELTIGQLFGHSQSRIQGYLVQKGIQIAKIRGRQS